MNGFNQDPIFANFDFFQFHNTKNSHVMTTPSSWNTDMITFLRLIPSCRITHRIVLIAFNIYT